MTSNDLWPQIATQPIDTGHSQDAYVSITTSLLHLFITSSLLKKTKKLTHFDLWPQNQRSYDNDVTGWIWAFIKAYMMTYLIFPFDLVLIFLHSKCHWPLWPLRDLWPRTGRTPRYPYGQWLLWPSFMKIGQGMYELEAILVSSLEEERNSARKTQRSTSGWVRKSTDTRPSAETPG